MIGFPAKFVPVANDLSYSKEKTGKGSTTYTRAVASIGVLLEYEFFKRHIRAHLRVLPLSLSLLYKVNVKLENKIVDESHVLRKTRTSSFNDARENDRHRYETTGVRESECGLISDCRYFHAFAYSFNQTNVARRILSGFVFPSSTRVAMVFQS